MDYPIHQTQPQQPGEERKSSNPLKYTFDGHFLPKTPPDDDTPKTTESNHSNSETGQSSGSGYSDTNQTASFQLIANTMLRMELAELEMMKKRETARLEAEKRRAELEDEMTRMMLQTQSHIALFVSQNSSSKKRKSSSGDDNSSTSGTNTY